MPRFFLEQVPGETFSLTGENARHVACSLRMKPGETITVCDGCNTDYFCCLESVTPDIVSLRVLEKKRCAAEPRIKAELYICLPKSDKLEFIIQKSVELGVSRIVPVLSSRCVSRPDRSQYAKKRERWQKIALEAAKQSGRGKIPEVMPITEYADAIKELSHVELPLLFYECGGEKLSALIQGKQPASVGFLIGAEGGLSPTEVELAQTRGVSTATLGPRILRAETAPLTVLSILMYAFGEM